MNQIDIYVRSSALGGVGIHWRNALSGEPQEPTMLKQRVVFRNGNRKATVNSLINDTKPSVILARYHDHDDRRKILLEVTGLQASEQRSRQMGRSISEVVLWVGDDEPEVEAKLRKLAATALLSFWEGKTEFSSTICYAINFDGSDSFSIDRTAIENLYAFDHSLQKASNCIVEDGLIWLDKNAITSEQQLHSLANQMNSVSLPVANYPLVVVAEFRVEGTEKRIEYVGQEYKELLEIYPQQTIQDFSLPEAESETQKKTLEPETSTSTTSPNRIIIIMSCLLIMTIAIAIWIITQYQKTMPKIEVPQTLTMPSPTPLPIPTTSTNSAPQITNSQQTYFLNSEVSRGKFQNSMR